jgi:hypothetical protein
MVEKGGSEQNVKIGCRKKTCLVHFGHSGVGQLTMDQKNRTVFLDIATDEKKEALLCNVVHGIYADVLKAIYNN